MSKQCPIMSRMKDNYEKRSQTKLTRGVPVIIRLDGKAFHTYTRGLNKPFDEGLIRDMQQATLELCKQVQGAKCAYTQSDEISILVTDYDTIDTMAWFDYNVQKIVSVSASIATSTFNKLRLLRQCYDVIDYTARDGYVYECSSLVIRENIDNLQLANFDSRAFSIPMTDVPNYFLARQRDAVKNSIQMLAQSLFSQKELHGKNQNELQEMCFQKGHNWNDLSCFKKRGTYIDREFSEETGRNTWKISEETPLKFDKQFFYDRAIY